MKYIRLILSGILNVRTFIIFCCGTLGIIILSLFGSNIFKNINDVLLHKDFYLEYYYMFLYNAISFFLLVIFLINMIDIDNSYYIPYMVEFNKGRILILRTITILVLNSLIFIFYIVINLFIQIMTSYFILNLRWILNIFNIYLELIIAYIFILLFFRNNRKYLLLIYLIINFVYKLIIEDISKNIQKILFFVFPILNTDNYLLLVYKIAYCIFLFLIFLIKSKYIEY